MPVRLTDLVNRNIPKDMVFKFDKGDAVKYNDKLYRVQRRRVCDGNQAYLVHSCYDKGYKDKVLESELTGLTNDQLINELWDDFVYTGDDDAAFRFVLENMCRVCHMKNVEWCNNEDSTKYCLKYTCVVSGEVKTLEKNKV